jgi:hypothetical protein
MNIGSTSNNKLASLVGISALVRGLDPIAGLVGSHLWALIHLAGNY